MTNDVQLQNGYTRIANEILEALARTDLNGTQRRIIDVVIRQTDGYQRKEHEMSLNFISIVTNIHKMQIQRELTSLIDRKIITVVSEASFNKSRMMALNKNYDSWLNSGQLTKKLTVTENDNHTVSENANTTVSELANQIKKKENTKEIYSTFFEELWNLYPSKVGKGKISDTKKKELYRLGDEFKRCISRYINYVKAEREKGFTDLKYQNGSTFFNGGYVDYLDENYKEVLAEPLDYSNWRGSDKRL